MEMHALNLVQVYETTFAQGVYLVNCPWVLTLISRDLFFRMSNSVSQVTPTLEVLL